MASASFELRECFHLVVLRLLAQRLTGRPYAVKGGMGLRLFHRSPRLSEDMDLDVSAQVGVKTLQNAVDTMLSSRVLPSALATFGLTGLEVARPKQTETVQRWKIGLIVGESRLPTKLEFSRRNDRIVCDVGMPDREILHHYRQSPFVAPYYSGASMVGQKLLALASAGRNAARDLCDLHHLLVFCQTDARPVIAALDAELFTAACAKIARFSYDDFAGQVLPYLTADVIAAYADRAAFEAMRAETLVRVKGGGP